MSNFETSDIYKKALSEYQYRIYWELLKPIQSIVVNNDEVYLFYNQAITDEICSKLKEIYESEEETDFPVNIGCEAPKVQRIKFMWQEYKTISLWYDNGEVPKQFQAKI